VSTFSKLRRASLVLVDLKAVQPEGRESVGFDSHALHVLLYRITW